MIVEVSAINGVKFDWWKAYVMPSRWVNFEEMLHDSRPPEKVTTLSVSISILRNSYLVKVVESSKTYCGWLSVILLLKRLHECPFECLQLQSHIKAGHELFITRINRCEAIKECGYLCNVSKQPSYLNCKRSFLFWQLRLSRNSPSINSLPFLTQKWPKNPSWEANCCFFFFDVNKYGKFSSIVLWTRSRNNVHHWPKCMQFGLFLFRLTLRVLMQDTPLIERLSTSRSKPRSRFEQAIPKP